MLLAIGLIAGTATGLRAGLDVVRYAGANLGLLVGIGGVCFPSLLSSFLLSDICLCEDHAPLPSFHNISREMECHLPITVDRYMSIFP